MGQAERSVALQPGGDAAAGTGRWLHAPSDVLGAGRRYGRGRNRLRPQTRERRRPHAHRSRRRAAGFRGATVSTTELESLRRIKRIIRRGKVRHIGSQVFRTEGEVAADPDQVYVDCTAAGVRPTIRRPIFEDDRITLQYVTIGIVPWGAATADHDVACKPTKTLQRPPPDAPAPPLRTGGGDESRRAASQASSRVARRRLAGGRGARQFRARIRITAPGVGVGRHHDGCFGLAESLDRGTDRADHRRRGRCHPAGSRSSRLRHLPRWHDCPGRRVPDPDLRLPPVRHLLEELRPDLDLGAVGRQSHHHRGVPRRRDRQPVEHRVIRPDGQCWIRSHSHQERDGAADVNAQPVERRRSRCLHRNCQPREPRHGHTDRVCAPHERRVPARGLPADQRLWADDLHDRVVASRHTLHHRRLRRRRRLPAGRPVERGAAGRAARGASHHREGLRRHRDCRRWLDVAHLHHQERQHHRAVRAVSVSPTPCPAA